MVVDSGKKLKSLKEKLRTGLNKKFSHGYIGNTNISLIRPTSTIITESKPWLELMTLMDTNKTRLLKN